MTALLTIPGADDDVQRLVRVLDEVGPRGLSAAKLMPRIGIIADDPVGLHSRLRPALQHRAPSGAGPGTQWLLADAIRRKAV